MLLHTQSNNREKVLRLLLDATLTVRDALKNYIAAIATHVAAIGWDYLADQFKNIC